MKTKTVELKRSIEEHWKLGRELLENWRAPVYGKGVAVNLAKKGVAGLESAEDVHFHRRLAERCPLELVQAADEAGLAWNRFVGLLSYFPSPNDRKRAMTDANLKKALRAREVQAQKFIAVCKQGELVGVDFTRAVMGWREENIGFWSAGKQRRRQFDHEVLLSRRLTEVITLIKAYQDRLSASKRNEVDARMAVVRRALEAAERALCEALSAKATGTPVERSVGCVELTQKEEEKR